MRVIAFTILTPFYFLKAGSLVRAAPRRLGRPDPGLSRRQDGRPICRHPAAHRFFRFDRREGMYTTLLMSTGLTFGSISALFGLTNHIIDEQPVYDPRTAVIASAVVPTISPSVGFSQPSSCSGVRPEPSPKPRQ